jgi:hypothetical protein
MAKKTSGNKTNQSSDTSSSTTRSIASNKVPCICKEYEDGWYCMKELPNGSLEECDGPFDTEEECQSHFCRN